jgi:hypothetical protein
MSALGDQGEAMRAIFANAALRNLLRGAAARELKAKGDIQFDSGPPDGLGRSFSWGMTVEGYGYAGSQDGVLFAETSPMGANIGSLEAMAAAALPQRDGPAASERTEDYFLSCAFLSERRTHIIAPPGYRVERLPTIANVNLGPVTLTRTISLEKDGSVTVLQRVESPRRRYTPAEAKTIASGLRGVTSAPNIRIEFVRARTN